MARSTKRVEQLQERLEGSRIFALLEDLADAVSLVEGGAASAKSLRRIKANLLETLVDVTSLVEAKNSP